jgi:hypothetical protein
MFDTLSTTELRDALWSETLPDFFYKRVTEKFSLKIFSDEPIIASVHELFQRGFRSISWDFETLNLLKK